MGALLAGEAEPDASENSESLSKSSNCEFCGESAYVQASANEKGFESKNYGLPAVFCSESCQKKFELWVTGRSKDGPRSMRLEY